MFTCGGKATNFGIYFRNCRMSDGNCDYQHVQTGVVADPPGSRSQPQKLTCYFWDRGNTCELKEEECMCRSFWGLFIPLFRQRDGWITRESAMLTWSLIADAHYYTGKVARPPASTVDALYVFFILRCFSLSSQIRAADHFCSIHARRAYFTFSKLTILEDAD